MWHNAAHRHTRTHTHTTWTAHENGNWYAFPFAISQFHNSSDFNLKTVKLECSFKSYLSVNEQSNVCNWKLVMENLRKFNNERQYCAHPPRFHPPSNYLLDIIRKLDICKINGNRCSILLDWFVEFRHASFNQQIKCYLAKFIYAINDDATVHNMMFSFPLNAKFLFRKLQKLLIELISTDAARIKAISRIINI